MKYTIIATLFFLLLFTVSKAQIKLNVANAIKHCNKNITVCDTVVKMEMLNSNTRLLYLGSPDFKKSLHVIQTSPHKIHSTSSLIGDIVCITGVIHFKKKHYVLKTYEKILVLGPIDL